MDRQVGSKISLEGKVAIITGGGRGIGRGIAEVLAEHGAKIVITARSEDQLDHTMKCINDKGGIIRAIPADVTKEPDVTKLIKYDNKRIWFAGYSHQQCREFSMDRATVGGGFRDMVAGCRSQS